MGVRNKWLNSIKTGRLGRSWEGWTLDKELANINDVIDVFLENDILVRFPDLVVVERDDIKKNTRLVAVRMSRTDFHFLKRFPNGKWFHKYGDERIKTITKKEVFSSYWCDRSYNSKIIFLGYKGDY